MARFPAIKALPLTLFVLIISACSSEELSPGISQYGVGSLERAMADYTPDYYEPESATEKEEILKANAEVVKNVKRLISEGADINHQRHDNRHTPLHAAILLGSPELVRILLDAGASLELRGEAAIGQLTPIEWARFLQQKLPGKDFSEVIQTLEKEKNERE